MRDTNMARGWSGTAFNQVPDSENEIHGDRIARDLGFTGGLVPGVTVSAYLIHPAIEYWGEAWLDRGFAHVRVASPLYDEEVFKVEVNTLSHKEFAAKLFRPDGTESATAQVSLPDPIDAAPGRRGDALANKETKAPTATPENMKKLMAGGCLAVRYRWERDHPMATYLRDPRAMPALLNTGEGGEGLANMSLILGCSNWVLSRNAYMNPWLHLETRSQNYARIPLGTEILAEMELTDLFNKKGHEFVDARVNLFDLKDDQCLCSIDIRAIYKLRGV